MANTLTLREEYITALDEALKLETKTSNLGCPAEVKAAVDRAEKIQIPKIDMDGPANYSKTAGWVDGGVTWDYEEVVCDYDRGRKFTVDAVDNIDTAGGLYAQLMKNYIRRYEAPELDAYRFAKLAGTTGIGTTEGAALTTGAAVLAALRVGVSTLDEAEVPDEGRVLYITKTLLGLVEDLDTTKSRAVLNSFTKIITVPQSRFYTAITLLDGTTSGQEAGGYVKDETNGADINFLIVYEPGVLSYVKHNVQKIVSPEANQQTDGWLFFERTVALCQVLDEKKPGIYLHKAAA